MIISWTRVTDKLPENGRTYLVWNGNEMIVSEAHIYDEDHKRRINETAKMYEKHGGETNLRIAASLRSTVGRFEGFGLNWYFDDPEIYYTELPPSPNDLDEPPRDSWAEDWESRSVYFVKGSAAIQINATGFTDGEVFRDMEVWGNEIDLAALNRGQVKCLGRGSFRVFQQLAAEVADLKKDGWTEVKSPPEEFMKLKDCALKLTDKMVLFWGSPFSQWYNRPLTVDGIKYNCAEQFMMAMKATHFKDEESLKKIMASRDPKEQKAIGRMVKGFIPSVWDAVSREYVTTGNRAKFTQHEDLRQLLLETGDREIVEASPYDRLWGIGLAESDPRALDKSQWQGKNWLGECIMAVREELRKS